VNSAENAVLKNQVLLKTVFTGSFSVQGSVRISLRVLMADVKKFARTTIKLDELPIDNEHYENTAHLVADADIKKLKKCLMFIIRMEIERTIK
jgi:hypothetical protein